jgi:hypothetical protein
MFYAKLENNIKYSTGRSSWFRGFKSGTVYDFDLGDCKGD